MRMVLEYIFVVVCCHFYFFNNLGGKLYTRVFYCLK